MTCDCIRCNEYQKEGRPNPLCKNCKEPESHHDGVGFSIIQSGYRDDYYDDEPPCWEPAESAFVHPPPGKETLLKITMPDGTEHVATDEGRETAHRTVIAGTLEKPFVTEVGD